jgi:hypothetical protein
LTAFAAVYLLLVPVYTETAMLSVCVLSICSETATLAYYLFGLLNSVFGFKVCSAILPGDNVVYGFKAPLLLSYYVYTGLNINVSYKFPD